MGKMIEKIILSRGLEYAGWTEAVTETDPALARQCVCIDFTTPAAIRDIQDAQVEAMDVEPLDSKVSDTVRIA